MGKNRRRITALVGAAAVAGALLAVAPALGDQGPATQVEFHAFDGGPRIEAAGHQDQELLTKKSACNLADDGSLLKFAGEKQTTPPGIAGLGIGIKSSGSNSNGVPCSQVDSNEKLLISPGSDFSERAFSGVELDLEMSGNAIVHMKFSSVSGETAEYQLHTGTSADVLCESTQEDGAEWPGCDQIEPGNPTEVDSLGIEKAACNAPQNSGPNSGASDNCIWTVNPEFDATLIELTTSKGTVSLEGGSETFRPSIFLLADNAPVARDQVEYIDYTENADEEPEPHYFDLDASGNSLTVVSLGYTDDEGLFRTAAGGLVSVDSGVTPLRVTYKPPKDFTGSDFFPYTVSDPDGREASAEVTVYELLDCGDTVEVDNGVISGSYTRLGTACAPKIYLLDPVSTSDENEPPNQIPTIRFIPTAPGETPFDCSILPRHASCTDQYIGELTFRPLDAENPPVTGTLEYDPVPREDPENLPADAFRDMQWCKTDPLAGDTLPHFEDILPGPVNDDEPEQGESWCIISATTTTAGDGKTVTTWVVYGIGDPLKRIS